jgi:hypothetical protein
MEFITITLSINGLAIILHTNDLVNLPEVDYKTVVIPLGSISHFIQEENDEDGINVMLVNGSKYTITPGTITMVGTNDYKLLPSYVCPDNDTLLTDLLNLTGW